MEAGKAQAGRLLQRGSKDYEASKTTDLGQGKTAQSPECLRDQREKKDSVNGQAAVLEKALGSYLGNFGLASAPCVAYCRMVGNGENRPGFLYPEFKKQDGKQQLLTLVVAFAVYRSVLVIMNLLITNRE